MMPRDDAGVLVLSLDFELHWGVRDKKSVAAYEANLRGVRAAVPAMLDLFEAFGVGATWATVGLLFARDVDERARYEPAVKPGYADARLSPYGEPVGRTEQDDPFHYAPSLIRRIRDAPRQEVASHTFSHYYCLEPGQDREAFAADLASAVAIAAAHGLDLRSIVFPRNQHNPAYHGLLADHGFTCYRGNPSAWMYRAAKEEDEGPGRRAGRLCDAYLPLTGPHTYPWEALQPRHGVVDVPASFFLRPYAERGRYLEPLRRRRLRSALVHAARHGEIAHLWWHPHNFGTHLDENMTVLRQLLETYRHLHDRYGMQSLTMGQVAERALQRGGIAV